MQINTCLVVDVWEGNLDIDEAALKAGGVAGIGIRLNDMAGGHHMDTAFLSTWAAAVNFVRFPYFVYNPWVDDAANFDWLKAHMPPEAKSVAIDVEVIYNGYSPAKYAGELTNFLLMCNNNWKTIVYTGQWFLSYLTKWPRCDYWWAQYPTPTSYAAGPFVGWDDLKTGLDRLDKPFNASAIPGNLKMWQFSGDYFTLPGSSRKIDVNIFYGTETELAAYFSNGTIQPSDDPQQNPTVPAPVTLMRVRSDAEIMALPKAQRSDREQRNQGLPATVRIRGGTGNVNLSPSWFAFWARLNPSQMPYLTKTASGWHNQGQVNNVVQLTLAENVVQVNRIVGNQAYISHYNTQDAPPLANRLNINSLSPFVQLFTACENDHVDVSCYGRWPEIFIIANPGEDLWMDVRDLAPYTVTNVTVKVTASPWLNVRMSPSASAKTAGYRLWGSKVQIYAVTEDPYKNLWGRVDMQNYICLKYQGSFLTSWRG